VGSKVNVSVVGSKEGSKVGCNDGGKVLGMADGRSLGTAVCTAVRASIEGSEVRTEVSGKVGALDGTFELGAKKAELARDVGTTPWKSGRSVDEEALGAGVGFDATEMA